MTCNCGIAASDCAGSSKVSSSIGCGTAVGVRGFRGGATICDEKRMEGTITALLSIAGNAGADIPKVITFMTNAFLMITE